MSAFARAHALTAVICAFTVTAPSGLSYTGIAHAQEAVVAAPDAEALFTSADPKLHANKQVVYRIIHELLEANHWDKAGELLSDRYLQHNPNVASGREPVIAFFTQVLKKQKTPLPAKIAAPLPS